MYGRDGDLAKLNRDRQDRSLSLWQRKQANEAYGTIVRQLKDKKLMGLRLRLIRAARVQDMPAESRIIKQMRAYLKQDQETGT